MTYQEMAQRAKNATPEQVVALAYSLLRIYEAHRTQNNGTIMGEAGLCHHFEMEAKSVLESAGVIES